jgi:cell division transport system permease protein
MAVKTRYVLGEAWSVVRSGPRQTTMAVLLVALALYVPGLLALLARNLGRLAAAEGEPISVLITLDAAVEPRSIANRLATDPRVAKVRIVSSAAALERFRRAYPELGQALSSLEEVPFPPTLEVMLARAAPAGSGRQLAGQVRTWPGVESAESEEDYARRFGDAVRLLRAAGIFLGVVLTAAAILSVASAIRLALDLHREEIEIMRLMGATESAIRAPFWLYASGEGLAGGTLALLLLYVTHRFATAWLAREPHPVLSTLWVRFLDLPTALLLPLVGLAAGFIGSLLSMGRRA